MQARPLHMQASKFMLILINYGIILFAVTMDSQPAFTYSESITETPDHCVKSIQL